MPDKVIFLDIDGVLNHADYGEDIYYDKFAGIEVPLDKDNLTQLESLLQQVPDAKIVWSTDWKDCQTDKWNNWTNPRIFLESQPFIKERILGHTSSKMSSEHFHDIQWWLKDHSDVKTYVILEDSYFPNEWFGLEKHLVRVDPSKGLTKNDVEQAVKTLNEGENNG